MPTITEHNPVRYSALNLAMKRGEADDRINAFYQDLAELRVKHKLPDVHVVVRMTVETDSGGEVSAISSGHMGAVQEAEGMCAWAYAMAGERRRNHINEHKAQGAAMGRLPD